MRFLSVLVWFVAALAVAPPASKSRKLRHNRQVAVYLDGDRDDLLEQYATTAFRGNRSAAFASLIDLHIGKALELADARTMAEPVDFGTWDPRRLSRSLVNQLAGIVLEGADPGTAFDQAGVTEKTRRAWLKQGRLDMDAGKPSLHATLVYALKRAEAERTIERVQILGPEHAKWLLERQNSDVYGPPTRKTEATVQHALMPVIDFDRLDARETQELVRLLRKASPQGDDAVPARSRPVAELLPEDVIDVDVIAEDDGPEPAPAVDGGIEVEAPPPEAPELEKPDD